ncbi:Rab-like protein 3, partial [Mortierella sp. GBA43]
MHQNYRDPDFSAKVLVLGDSGVGKSSLVHMLCHNESLKNPMPTVGCNVDVRLHTYSVPTAAASAARSGVSSLLARPSPSPDTFSTSSTPGSDAAFVEFYDVSGSPTVRSPKTRGMFYSGTTYQGLILVHDLCNRRSYENLWKWIGDFIEGSQSTSSLASGGYRSQQYGHLGIPLLVVGTKNDMPASHNQQKNGATPFGHDLVEKHGGEAISVSTITPTDFAPNSSTSIAFNMFFNSVIDDPSATTGGGGTSFTRSRSSSNQSGYLGSAATSSPTPAYAKLSRPPSPGHIQPQHKGRAFPSESDSGAPAIPIVDFATFTRGAAVTDNPGDHGLTPPRTGSPSAPERPVTPTGVSSGAALSTKSALRAQYERNRSVLNQYNNVGVPTYT